MQTIPKVVAVNDHSNPEANHNLLPGGNPDSADCVVLEVPLQSGHPNAPEPAQVRQEQVRDVQAALRVAVVRTWIRRHAPVTRTPSPEVRDSFFVSCPGVPRPPTTNPTPLI